MSTCPKCYEDTGCTCHEQDRIKQLERQLAEAQAENKVIETNAENEQDNLRNPTKD